MSFLISDVLAQATPSADTPQAGWESLLFPIGLVVVFYFFLIRPQMKRQKEHKKLVGSLQKGDEVQLEGGLMGKLIEIGESSILVEVAEGIELKFRRSAVTTVMPKGSLKEV